MSKQAKLRDFFGQRRLKESSDSTPPEQAPAPQPHEPEEVDMVEVEEESADLDVEMEQPAKKAKGDAKKGKQERLFARKWLADFPWVRYNSALNTMYCQPCRNQGKMAPWGGDGTRNFR